MQHLMAMGVLPFFSLKIVVLPSSSIVNGCFKTCAFFGDYKSIQRGIMHHNDVQRTQAHILTKKVEIFCQNNRKDTAY